MNTSTSVNEKEYKAMPNDRALFNVQIVKSEIVFSMTGFNYEIATAENGDGTEDIYFDSALDCDKFKMLLSELN